MKPVKRKPVRPVKKPVKHDTRQTRTAGGNFVDKLHAYRDHHAHALFSSLGRLVATPFTSIMTIAVLAISMALASGFYIMVINVQQLTANLESSNQISLFLHDEVANDSAAQLANNIRQNPNVQSVKIISKEQALAEFKTYSGFGAAIDVLDNNPLPIVLQVLPKNSLQDKQELERLFKTVEEFKEVDYAQVDMQWVERLQSIVEVARCGTALFSFMIGIGVLFIIGNTIRLELHNRRDEVMISKLVGATNSFIRRPFLYTGFWIGFISGISAWFINAILMLILRQPVEKLSGLYEGDLHLVFLSFTETVELLAIASFLGIFSSWAVLIVQLRHTRPE
ncbi:MAG: permease-like cell division protein FtsX [Methylococcales bacterium]|nr:permease-like cell division protein FtsX [Methylococcales bacterium]MDP3837541.1 permease-like cell division protein FtsX [Methylococcales bacterium]